MLMATATVMAINTPTTMAMVMATIQTMVTIHPND